MAKNKAESAYRSLNDQTTEVYKTFQQEFEQQIATHNEPEETTRIQLLEQMVHKMNSDITNANMKYVGKMIESLDEESIIESKKENS
jgi:hypothetical protein